MTCYRGLLKEPFLLRVVTWRRGARRKGDDSETVTPIAGTRSTIDADRSAREILMHLEIPGEHNDPEAVTFCTCCYVRSAHRRPRPGGYSPWLLQHAV